MNVDDNSKQLSGSSVASNSEDSTDDEGSKSRAKRHSQKPYARHSDDPTKLGFYPPQWRDVMEKGKAKFRPWIAYECGFPDRENESHMDKALQSATDALSEHQQKGGKVEEGNCLANNPLRSNGLL